ncbi:MAG TPA: PP2C family serine/threonine-protein phosphatase [Actinomycetes bacterium]|nr:PP2C family serine/threonine-protein phosphatase [Actinomycetes bacterium]
MTLTLRTAARSDVGLVRTNNEDAAYVGPHLLAVADGMGGHAAGEIASSTVVAALLPLDEQEPGPDLDVTLRRGIDAANERLRIAVESSEAYEGMGTTLTAMLWDGTRLGVAQVGDSRAYLLRDGELRQITSDQTFVQRLVEEGRLTPEEAEHHPQRSLLLQALDGRSDVEPAVQVTVPQVGDRFLLCSDGLSDYVDFEAIAGSLSLDSPDLAADALVARALDNGAPDNVTVIVADVVEDGTVDVGRRLLGAAARETPAGPPGSPVEEEAAAAEREGAEPVPGRTTGAHAGDLTRSRWVWLATLGVVVVMAVGGIVVFWHWTQKQWFVGITDGVVTVSRGIDVDLPVLRLHHVVERTDLTAASLPQYELEQVSSGIPARDRAAADQTVERLREAAQHCLQSPTTQGCPS